MDFELTDEQELIREAVREFADTEVAPIAAELDRDHRFPSELLPKMHVLCGCSREARDVPRSRWCRR